MKSDTNLLFIEIYIVLFFNLFLRNGVYVKKSFDYFAADQIRVYDFFYVGQMHHTIQSVFGVNFNERSLRTETETTYLIYGYFIAEILFCNKFFEFRFDFVGVGRQTTRTAAKHYVSFPVRAREFGVKTFTALRTYLFEFLKILYHGVKPPALCNFL